MEVEGEINGESVERCLSSFIDGGTIESHRYYLARRTNLEMLKYRGFAVPNSEAGISLHYFRSIYGPKPDPDRLRVSTTLRSDPSKKITDLLVNITKHVLKPKHRVLTDREKQKLLKKYNLEEKQFEFSNAVPPRGSLECR